jgi:hypothetical protein
LSFQLQEKQRSQQNRHRFFHTSNSSKPFKYLCTES